MNKLNIYENIQKKNLSADKSFPDFKSGDTIKVHLKVKEGEKERVQVFEGICISRKNAGINSAFTVRKISYGEGIERVLPLFSPLIDKIEIVKSGDVKRSKLYYLRGRSGKSARITEKNVYQKDATPNKNENNKKVLKDKSENENAPTNKVNSTPEDTKKASNQTTSEEKKN